MSYYDIAIIGAGPTGIFSAFQAGMLGMQAVVIDILDFIGGQCTALYPEKPIYDIPAFKQIAAEDLIKNLQDQASTFNPTYLLGQQVTAFDCQKDGVNLSTSNNVQISVKAVIIAAGCGAFGPNKPPLLGIEQFENKSVLYYIRNKHLFSNKTLAIAGGGDSAIDWAIELAGIAKKIYLIHRRDKFRASPANLRKIQELKDKNLIEILTPYQLEAIDGENGMIKTVQIYSLDGQKKLLEIDYLLPFFGLSMELGPIVNWGLNLHKSHIEVAYHNMQTSIKRVYAIGDIAHYPGKLKLILNGFAESAMACHDAYHWVHPDKPLHFEYSTTKGISG